MTDPQNIFERKREKKLEIEEKYSKKDPAILSLIVSEDEVKDTAELAQGFETSGFPSTGFTIRNSTGTAAFHLVIVHMALIGIPVLADKEFKQTVIFIVVEIVFGLAAIFGWVNFLNRKPKVKMDGRSINFLVDNTEIEWADLLTTHVRSSYTPKNQYEKLIVNFYEPYTDSFVEKVYDLTYFNVTKWGLAAAIEYYRQLSMQSAGPGITK